ncbi:MAG: RnfABCDGE type electron transport complex subunit B [Spirochaetales bacterium]|nr:RnfABCDGE type electron transport complex subunit B [Spirochaetales bacterium]
MALVRIVYAVASVAGLGIFLGLGLAVASRLLAVRKDERVEAIEKALPGSNCGACGFAGCAAYAAEIVGGEVALDLCTVGGANVAKRIAEILGVDYEAKEEGRRVPQVHCRGGRQTTQYAFDYSGVQDCVALYTLFGGDKVCKYGCLGLGSCMRVCPVDAIYYDSEGLVWVNKEVCISCGRCVDICPTGVMQWLPYEADYVVACSSRDKGGQVRKYCKVGCIACKICEKKSPEGGYKVEDNLSRIDYTAGGDRREAAEACPTKCIIANDIHPKR